MNCTIRSLPTIAFTFLLALLVTLSVTTNASAQAIAEPLKKAEYGGAFKAQLSMVEAEIRDATNRVDETSSAIKKSTDGLRSKGVSDLAFEDVFRLLHVQRVELAIELKGFEARLVLLEKKLGDVKELDPSEKLELEGLQRQVELIKQRAESTKRLKAKGARSHQDLQSIQHSLAAAELKLKSFRWKAQQPTTNQMDATFETTLAIAERKAKLEAVEEMIAKHTEARPEVAALNDLKDGRSHEIEQLRSLTSKYKELKRKGESKF